MDAYRRFLRERDARPRPGAGLTERTAPPPDRRDPIAARRAAAAWAARIAADPEVMYLDTETTGGAAHDEVIELALVDNAGSTRFETLIRPRRPIPREVIAVHGITDAHVADAPTLPEVAELLHGWLHGRTLVVYNAPFDRRMVMQSCAGYGCPAPNAVWECAMRRYADFAGEWNAAKGGYRWHRLERAVRAFGEPPGGHRAAADALACRHVVHGMAAWRGDEG